MEMHDKSQKMLGLKFSYKYDRVLIYKATLEGIGYPEFYRFRLDVDKRYFAIEACGMNAESSHRFRGFSTKGYCQSSLGLISAIYDLCGWDYEKTYTVFGIILFDGQMVGFDLKKAEEGREE